MIWLEFVVCFIAGVITALSSVIGLSFYAMKHPEKMTPYIMRAMKKRK